MSITTAGSHLRRLDDITPSIVSVLVDLGAACIVDTDNVALQIRLQIIDGVCEVRSRACAGKRADGNGLSGCVVVVTNILHHRRRSGGRTSNHLAVDLTANNIVFVTDIIYDFNRSDSLIVVLIRGDFGRTVFYFLTVQMPSPL